MLHGEPKNDSVLQTTSAKLYAHEARHTVPAFKYTNNELEVILLSGMLLATSLSIGPYAFPERSIPPQFL